MFARLHGRVGHYPLLLAAGLVMFFYNLGAASLWDVDEGNNATCSLEMLESGDYVVPYFNARLRVDKPPLLYWCQVLAYRLFGINEFAVRFPSALAAMIAVFLCYELGRDMFRVSTGLIAGLAVAGTPMLAGAARFANPDALLNLFTLTTLTLFWRGQTRPSRLWFAVMGASAGLAVLAKGPVGILLPGAVVLLFLLREKRLALLWDRRIGVGFLTLALVALPWYVWVAVETHADFLKGFVLQHNVGRFLSTMENHRGSPLYYLLVLVGGLGLWSCFIAGIFWFGAWSALKQPWQRWAALWRKTADQDTQESTGGSLAPAYRFLLCWIGCYLVFFSLAATKLPNYILPVAVPSALLLGRALDRWRLGRLQLPGWAIPVSLIFIFGVGLAASICLALAPIYWPSLSGGGTPPPGLAMLALAGLVPMLMATAAWWFSRRRRPDSAIAVLLAGTILFLGPLAAWAPVFFNHVKAVKPLVEQAGALRRAEDIHIGGWQFNQLPSLNYYAQREITHHQNEAEALAFLRYPVRVFLFLPAQNWIGLAQQAPPQCRLIARHWDIQRRRELVVVTNQPE